MALAVLDAVLDGERTNLRADDGVIVALGPDVAAEPGDEVLDAGGRLALVSGLVNAHGHAAMTLFRGYGSDLQLQEWLEHMIWPAEARLTTDDIYWGTRLAALEMIRSGTTHFYDMYWHPEVVARAAEDAGLRATVGAPLLDGHNPAGISALRDAALTSLDALADAGPLVEVSLTPHALYTVSDDSLEWVGQLAAERGLILQLHLSETRREVEEWLATHDDRPTFHADRFGLLGPRTLLAHGCQLDRSELELIAERGATVVSNPVSNLKLAGSDIFPYPLARECGVAVGLGTDGASSNNGLDLFADTKIFALVQKQAAGDPTVITAAEALELAQGRRSALLGGRPLAVGAPADFLLVDTSLPTLNPGPLVENLVYAPASDLVRTSVIHGRVVMRDRVVPDADEIIAEAVARAARVIEG